MLFPPKSINCSFPLNSINLYLFIYICACCVENNFIQTCQFFYESMFSLLHTKHICLTLNKYIKVYLGKCYCLPSYYCNHSFFAMPFAYKNIFIRFDLTFTIEQGFPTPGPRGPLHTSNCPIIPAITRFMKEMSGHQGAWCVCMCSAQLSSVCVFGVFVSVRHRHLFSNYHEQ